MPKLSIIIPIYNGEAYISRCLDSVLNQRFQDFEILLVNDGSTDSSGELCDQYMESDSRIKVIHQRNTGQSLARKAGLDRATGEYIGFVDVDDWITNTMYSHLIEIIEKNECDIALIGAETTKKYKNKNITNNNINTLEKDEILYTYLSNGLINSQNEYSLWNKIYKRELFDNLIFDYGNYGEDYIINYYLFNKASKMVRSTKIGYYYYQSSGSSIRDRLKKSDLNLLDNCLQVKKITRKSNDKRLVELADLKLSQSYYSLLVKGRIYGVENDMGKSDIKKLQRMFRKKYSRLMHSQISVIKKLLMTCLLITDFLKIPYNIKDYENEG